MLAYYFLWRAPAARALDRLPGSTRHIEDYLREKTGIEINFEVGDALTKLYRLGLADAQRAGPAPGHAAGAGPRGPSTVTGTTRSATPTPTGTHTRPPGLERC